MTNDAKKTTVIIIKIQGIQNTQHTLHIHQITWVRLFISSSVIAILLFSPNPNNLWHLMLFSCHFGQQSTNDGKSSVFLFGTDKGKRNRKKREDGIKHYVSFGDSIEIQKVVKNLCRKNEKFHQIRETKQKRKKKKAKGKELLWNNN